MSVYWKAVVGIILIYIFGVISGIFGSSIFIHHKMRDMLRHPALIVMKMVEKRLTGNLNLDVNQKHQINAYFIENLKHRKELLTQIQPQLQLLNLETLQEISATLRPDQLERFHQNLDDFRKRMAANGLNPAESLPMSCGGAVTNSGVGTPPGL
jgi:hypothetical protein